MKRARIRPRSDKMAERYVLRRQVVNDIVDARGDRCQFTGCKDQANDAHEILARSAQGSITDPNNILLLCRWHHNLITNNPKWARENGYSRSRWA